MPNRRRNRNRTARNRTAQHNAGAEYDFATLCKCCGKPMEADYPPEVADERERQAVESLINQFPPPNRKGSDLLAVLESFPGDKVAHFCYPLQGLSFIFDIGSNCKSRCRDLCSRVISAVFASNDTLDVLTIRLRQFTGDEGSIRPYNLYSFMASSAIPGSGYRRLSPEENESTACMSGNGEMLPAEPGATYL
jgi:hypothetical protein